MKTIANSVSSGLLGCFVLLGLLCTPFLLFNYDALSELFQSFKSGWQHLAQWMAGGMN